MDKLCIGCKHLQMKYFNHSRFGKVYCEAFCKIYNVTIKERGRWSEDYLKRDEIERLDRCMEENKREE